ncbi:predicted protein [Chaetoceros tenuissimus]|uniref:Uncharacterized protein n=1 Tax=Chaetoceros tenuissimus TaxID=426638 RepID=A0AAD3D050_9STRA|nr:predicted protein [Chaetoceros tenuissimus]
MEEQGKQNTRGEADVESNSSIMLELNDSIINEARHAPSAPHSTKDTSYTPQKLQKIGADYGWGWESKIYGEKSYVIGICANIFIIVAVSLDAVPKWHIISYIPLLWYLLKYTLCTAF